MASKYEQDYGAYDHAAESALYEKYGNAVGSYREAVGLERVPRILPHDQYQRELAFLKTYDLLSLNPDLNTSLKPADEYVDTAVNVFRNLQAVKDEYTIGNKIDEARIKQGIVEFAENMPDEFFAQVLPAVGLPTKEQLLDAISGCAVATLKNIPESPTPELKNRISPKTSMPTELSRNLSNYLGNLGIIPQLATPEGIRLNNNETKSEEWPAFSEMSILRSLEGINQDKLLGFAMVAFGLGLTAFSSSLMAENFGVNNLSEGAGWIVAIGLQAWQVLGPKVMMETQFREDSWLERVIDIAIGASVISVYTGEALLLAKAFELNADVGIINILIRSAAVSMIMLSNLTIALGAHWFNRGIASGRNNGDDDRPRRLGR